MKNCLLIIDVLPLKAQKFSQMSPVDSVSLCLQWQSIFMLELKPNWHIQFQTEISAHVEYTCSAGGIIGIGVLESA